MSPVPGKNPVAAERPQLADGTNSSDFEHAAEFYFVFAVD